MLCEMAASFFFDRYEGVVRVFAQFPVTVPARFKFVLVLSAAHHDAGRCNETTFRSPPSVVIDRT
jgi:hypothetical protein